MIKLISKPCLHCNLSFTLISNDARIYCHDCKYTHRPLYDALKAFKAKKIKLPHRLVETKYYVLYDEIVLKPNTIIAFISNYTKKLKIGTVINCDKKLKFCTVQTILGHKDTRTTIDKQITSTSWDFILAILETIPLKW